MLDTSLSAPEVLDRDRDAVKCSEILSPVGCLVGFTSPLACLVFEYSNKRVQIGSRLDPIQRRLDECFG